MRQIQNVLLLHLPPNYLYPAMYLLFQLTNKTLSSSSQTELENRLHQLTETLIQKQTMLEALGTEKSSLVFQLERMEQQLKNAQGGQSGGPAINMSGLEGPGRQDWGQKWFIFLGRVKRGAAICSSFVIISLQKYWHLVDDMRPQVSCHKTTIFYSFYLISYSSCFVMLVQLTHQNNGIYQVVDLKFSFLVFLLVCFTCYVIFVFMRLKSSSDFIPTLMISILMIFFLCVVYLQEHDKETHQSYSAIKTLQEFMAKYARQPAQLIALGKILRSFVIIVL